MSDMPKSSFLALAMLTASFGGLAMLPAEGIELRQPKRLPAIEGEPRKATLEPTIQTVGHRTSVVQEKSFARRPLASKMTAFVPRQKPTLQTGSACICPACDHVCHLDAQQVDVERSCFETESKVICIPRVVFPWQKKKCSSCDSCDGVGCSNCVHNGARTREVNVLKVKKYKCPECQYTWSAKFQPTCCDGACDSGCDTSCESSCDPGCPPIGPYSSEPMLYREFEEPVDSAVESSDEIVQELTGPGV